MKNTKKRTIKDTPKSNSEISLEVNPMEKKPKEVHSIRVDPDLWKKARYSDINISEWCEKILEIATDTKKARMFRNLSHCLWCKKHRPLTQMREYCFSGDEGETIIDYTSSRKFNYMGVMICNDCVGEIEQAKTFNRVDDGFAIFFFWSIKFGNRSFEGSFEEIIDKVEYPGCDKCGLGWYQNFFDNKLVSKKGNRYVFRTDTPPDPDIIVEFRSVKEHLLPKLQKYITSKVNIKRPKKVVKN